MEEKGLLLLSLLWEIKVVQNNYRAKVWNTFNVFRLKKQLEIHHFYGHNKVFSLKHAFYCCI